MNLPPAEMRRIELLRKGGWVKSSRSNSGMCCVEVLATADGWIHLRDSKYRREARGPWHLEPMLSVTRAEFDRLLDLVAGLPQARPADLYLRHEEGGEVLLGSRATGTTLRFFDSEWTAFRLSAQEGEFAATRLAVSV